MLTFAILREAGRGVVLHMVVLRVVLRAVVLLSAAILLDVARDSTSGRRS